jgi:hypothetical protein
MAKLIEALRARNNPKRSKVLTLDKYLPARYTLQIEGHGILFQAKEGNNLSYFLLALTVIGQFSDVTGYCSIIEEVEYPKDPQDYFLNELSRFIVLVWKDRKGRPSCHKTQCLKYRIQLYANPQDVRYYCSVHRVFKEWSLCSR